MPATTKLFGAGALKFSYGATGTSTKVFAGVPQIRYSANLQEVMEACGLNIDPDFLAVTEAIPAIDADIVELATFIDPATLDGLNGFNYGDTGTTGNKQEVQLAQFEKFKGRFSQASVKHAMLTSSRGLAYLKSFRASRRTVARGSMRMAPIYDGTLDPIVPSQDVAGLVFAPIAELFTVGPLLWNGVPVGTVTDIAYDLGDELEYAGFGGETWPDFVGFAGRRPTFTVTCKDVPQIVVQSITGSAQSATDSELYLRGLERNKKRYPNATAKHIKFTFDEGRIAVESISAGNRGSADVVLKLMPAYDGTNLIIVTAVNTTIPAGE